MSNRHAKPGTTTMVGTRLRIVNGTVESLKRFPKKAGRKKIIRDVVPVPDYPNAVDLKSLTYRVRAGFHPIRTRKDWEHKAENSRNLQKKFDALCSKPRFVDHFDNATYSRIERSVPGSFCSCKHDSPCLVHGAKLEGCDCGGIDGITGYRVCAGHRKRGHMPGVRPFPETERMREARESADQVAKEMGWI